MPKAIASRELREEIRKAYQSGEGTFDDLAVKFGVSKSAIENWSRRCKWNASVMREKVTALVTANLAEDLTARLKRAFNWPLERWAKTLTGVAGFDPSEMFEVTPEGTTVLRSDWLKVAKRHGALESVQVDTTTLESGQVVSRLKIKPYDRMAANDKIGKVLGYDVTKDAEPAPVQIAVVLHVEPIRINADHPDSVDV